MLFIFSFSYYKKNFELRDHERTRKINVFGWWTIINDELNNYVQIDQLFSVLLYCCDFTTINELIIYKCIMVYFSYINALTCITVVDALSRLERTWLQYIILFSGVWNHWWWKTIKIIRVMISMLSLLLMKAQF